VGEAAAAGGFNALAEEGAKAKKAGAKKATKQKPGKGKPRPKAATLRGPEETLAESQDGLRLPLPRPEAAPALEMAAPITGKDLLAAVAALGDEAGAGQPEEGGEAGGGEEHSNFSKWLAKTNSAETPRAGSDGEASTTSVAEEEESDADASPHAADSPRDSGAGSPRAKQSERKPKKKRPRRPQVRKTPRQPLVPPYSLRRAYYR
jgi:hypothetical protein